MKEKLESLVVRPSIGKIAKLSYNLLFGEYKLNK